MKNKVIAAVAVLTFGATMAVAEPHKGGAGKRGHRGEFGAKFAQKLNLTDTQKEQIKAIKKDSREQNADFFAAARQTRQDLRAARQANDTARAEALAATLETQRAQMKQIRTAERERILTILTPEQRTQLEQFKGKRGNKR